MRIAYAVAMRSAALVALSMGVLGVCVAREGMAQTGESAMQRAGAAFDDGVARFKRADYEGAAKAFLLADELAPNPQAITNALAAARRANDFLTVATAAERVLARGDSGPLGTSAREALADAASRLSAIEASCEPTSCALSIDGNRVAAGRTFVLPGTHDVVGESPDGARGADHLNTVAGATYRVALRADRPASLPQSAQPVEPAPTHSGDANPIVPPTANPNESASTSSADRDKPADRKMSPTVFYVGVGASAVLLAVTTWSGLDALALLHKKDDDKPNYDPTAVKSAARRTDVLVIGTAFVGAMTGYIGLRLVNWAPTPKGDHPTASISIYPGPSGGGITGLVRF